jgi:hypothetical protein
MRGRGRVFQSLIYPVAHCLKPQYNAPFLFAQLCEKVRVRSFV